MKKFPVKVKVITKSIASVPIKIEMSEVKHTSEHALTIDELSEQIDEARKGTARVDSQYVGNGEGLNHVFEYKYDYAQFLESMAYIIQEAKARKEEDRYKNSHEMIIQ